MWLTDDGTYKARIIYTGETNWRQSVIEVFRWSEEASGWVHVADVADPDELASLVDLAKLTEFTESMTLPA